VPPGTRVWSITDSAMRIYTGNGWHTDGNDFWERTNDLPSIGAFDTLVATTGGKAILFHGVDFPFAGASAKTSEFTGNGTSWAAKADAPEAHGQAVIVELKNGKILVAGGFSGDTGTQDPAQMTNLCRIYDPTTHTYAAADNIPQKGATFANAAQATLLKNGKVLVLGLGWFDQAVGPDVNGNFSYTPSNRALLFDPAAAPGAQWTSAANMITARAWTECVLLNDGKVLVTGGRDGTNPDNLFTTMIAACEVYNPTANTWAAKAALPVTAEPQLFNFNNDSLDVTPVAGRFAHALVRMVDGRILAVGGIHESFGMRSSCLIYDPNSDTWTETARLRSGRGQMNAIRSRQGGGVFCIGGWNNYFNNSVEADLFDNVSETLTPLADLPCRPDPSMFDGCAYIFGGFQQIGLIESAIARPPAVLLSNNAILMTAGGADFAIFNDFNQNLRSYQESVVYVPGNPSHRHTSPGPVPSASQIAAGKARLRAANRLLSQIP
jgi:N-acetylneuraminic acid mutarotase